MPDVWERVPDATLLIAGPEQPDTQKIKNVHSKTLADPRVSDLGFVSNDEREDLLAACDVLCVPSRHEAYGLVFAEAAHYGTPVVARALPALEELIGSYNGGLLVDSERGIAHALCNLLINDQLRERMGRSAYTEVRDRTWRSVAEILKSVYIEHVKNIDQRDVAVKERKKYADKASCLVP
jgi:glycosyltransferase involved in cell wall biosynthesis